jgi:ribosomal protein S27E
MFPKQVKCEACGAAVAVQQSIPVFEMELNRPSHLESEPKSWCCVVHCPECGQRTQYVTRVDPPASSVVDPPRQTPLFSHK